MGDIGLILSQTFATISDPMAILMVFAGTFMGLTFGALPGLTATMGVALLVPITDSMDPAIAIGMMLGLVLGQKFEWELPTTLRQFGGLGILLKRPIALDFVAVACVIIAKFVYTGVRDMLRNTQKPEELGIQIVGDDLFTTNPERVRYGISKGAASTMLFKVNQVGTIRERACYPVGNRFLEIEWELGPRARFRGLDGFKGSRFARK